MMRGATQSNGNNNGVQPRVLNLLAKQQYELAKNLANGIIFYQNEDGDLLDIQADIIGPVQTAYEGGIFRCKLVIESGFPQSAPKGFFLTKIFHPNVAVNTGEICVNTLKRDWNPAKWSLKHIFEVIRCLLIVPFPESSLNEEAGREFMGDYDSFCEHATVYTQIHAKPNAAQKVIILQRQKEEQEQQANEDRQQQQQQQASQQMQGVAKPSDQLQRQQTLVQQIPARTVQQENTNQLSSLLPQSQLTQLQEQQHAQTSLVPQQLHSQQYQQQQQQQSSSFGDQPMHSTSIEKQQLQRFMTPEEESKLIHMAQPVLSQVTNSFERPAGSIGAIKVPLSQQPLVIMDHENSLASYKKSGQIAPSSYTKMQQFSILSQMTSASQIIPGNNRDSHLMNKNMIDTEIKNTQIRHPLLVRRPSVLYKKKVETAKQRQERYIRRV